MTFDTRTLSEVRELTAAEVDRELRRGHGWAARHAVELGGRFEDGRWRFAVAHIRDWQERQAAEYAERRAS